MGTPQMVSGTFNGTGADLYISLGFVPDWFEGWTLETTDEERIRWSINMRSLEMLEGVIVDDDGTQTPLAYGEGIAVYRGGDKITADSTVYISRDLDPDKRDKGTGAVINAWTLDTLANRTGHWNDVCDTTYVGEGSRICIDGKWYTVTAVTSNGEASDEVTLSEAAPSGKIEALTGMYDFLGVSAGFTTGPGVLISNTTFNVASQLCMFEAGTYN
jgi:hypothetical protein